MKAFQIRQNFKADRILAADGISRICKKGQISPGAGAELRYSPTNDS